LRLVVQPINGRAVSTRHQVPVGVDRDLNARASHLVPRVGQGLALLNQQARKRVPEVVEPDVPQVGRGQDAIERAAQVPDIEVAAVK
jgi:hypothetical protein